MIKAVVASSYKRAKEALHGRGDIPHPISRVALFVGEGAYEEVRDLLASGELSEYEVLYA